MSGLELPPWINTVSTMAEVESLVNSTTIERGVLAILGAHCPHSAHKMRTVFNCADDWTEFHVFAAVGCAEINVEMGLTVHPMFVCFGTALPRSKLLIQKNNHTATQVSIFEHFGMESPSVTEWCVLFDDLKASGGIEHVRRDLAAQQVVELCDTADKAAILVSVPTDSFGTPECTRESLVMLEAMATAYGGLSSVDFQGAFITFVPSLRIVCQHEAGKKCMINVVRNGMMGPIEFAFEF